MSGTQLVLATSAQKGEYMRDFLTCLASPDGHRVAFSYRRGWFDQQLLPQLAGREAVIVFCDAEHKFGEFVFLPVRHVQIEELVPDSTDAAWITVVFRLGSLVAVTDAQMDDLMQSWQSSFTSVDYRPRPTGHPDEARALFVFEHPELAEATDSPEPKDSWRVLSERLGKCTTLEKAFFFRVGELRSASAKPGAPALATEQVGSLRHVYPLKPSDEYELPMDAYSRSGKVSYSDAIQATSSSEQLTVQAITQSSAGRASEAVLVLRAGEVKRAQLATLVIQGAEGFEHVVPRVEIATRVKPNLRLAAMLMVLIAGGVLLSGLSKGALGLPEGLIYGLKALGGLVVGGVTLWAVGRVPGIGN